MALPGAPEQDESGCVIWLCNASRRVEPRHRPVLPTPVTSYYGGLGRGSGVSAGVA
jgi:hypothetical protein